MQGTVGGRPIHVLLVDDDVAYLEVLKFFLERDGVIEGETATSARQALELLSRKEFDAVVSDYLMPDMDGLELLKIIRLQGKNVPFIMLTGRGREDVAIQAMNNGADFYIQKGGDPKVRYADLTNMIVRSTRQRRAERDVIDGERFLTKLFESIQDGVSVLSKDMVIEKVNPVIERWYADSLPLIGKKCYEAYRGRLEPCEGCPTIRTIRSGRTSSERMSKHEVGDGCPEWIEVYSFPMLNEETRDVEGVIEYIRDVTDEELAKASLRDSELRYRTLLDLASEGILAMGPDGAITFANPRMAEMLGYEVEDLVGKHISSLVDKKWADFMGSTPLQRALSGGERLELVLARKDGSQANVFVAASPISSDSGFLDGAMAVVTDISELKRVMTTLVSSEEKFAKVFHDSPQMIMIARTSDSTILEANDSFAKVTGFRRDQLLGKDFMELGIVTKELAETVEQAFAEHGIVRDLESVIGTATGEERLVRLSGYRMMLEGETCTIFVSCDLSSEVAGVKDLKRERDVLRAVLDSASDGIVIADMGGNMVECNPAISDLLGGVPKEMLVGRSVFQMLNEGDSANANRIMAKLIKEGVLKDLVFKLTRADETVIDVNISASVVKDPLGVPLYLVGILRDVTDRVRHLAAQETALEGRRQLVSIINQSPAVAFVWRAEPGWPVDYVSENVRQFGYEAGELTSGMFDFAAVVHPEDIGRVASEVQSYVDEGTSEFEQEYRLVSPDGRIFWVYDRTIVLRDSSGKVDAYQGVVVDITDRKEVSERLSRTERQLKMFMDLSPVIKFMKDKAGRYVYVNKKHTDAFGLMSGEWLGRTDAEVFPSDVAERIFESDRKVFETGMFQMSPQVIPQLDGPHEYLTYKFIVPDISGGDDLLAGVAVDLTDERKYERALRMANEKLNLLGNMTRHDIANQLAVLIGWLDVVRDDETDPVSARRLDDMKKAADTIHRLLMFTSEYQDMGVQNPIWMAVDESAAGGVEGLPMMGVRLEVDVPGLQIYADPMFERVFRNLVDNSLRHGEKVSRVRLSTRIEGKELVLVYEDDGVGVPESVKDQIFEKGFGKHTGFGLFMVRQVLALTRMSIRETGAEGTGARFEIRIPEGNYRYSTSKD